MYPAEEGPPSDPPPVEPVFPFHEAQAVVRALEDLIGALDTLSSQQRSYAEALLTPTFSGTFRQRFEEAHEEASQDLDRQWKGSASVLEGDLTQLRTQIQLARQRHDAWTTDLDRWQGRKDRVPE
jgi:hypothetical protein